MNAMVKSCLHRAWLGLAVTLLAAVGSSANAQIETECPDPSAVYASAAMTAPAQGSDFYPAAQSVTLSAIADASGATVSGIELRTGGGALIGTISGSVGSIVWSGLGAGTYSVYASPIATSQYAYCTVNIYPSALLTFTVSPYTPSTVTVGATGNGTTAPATINLSTTISGRNPIYYVDYLANGSQVAANPNPPHNATWSNVWAGTFNMQARAWDIYGGISLSSPTTVVIGPNPPPTVNLTVTSNTGVAPATVVLDATASDPLGISRVEFRTGTTLLGTATSAPYRYTWSGVAAGTYNVFARAFNNYPTSADSVSRSVVVSGVAPPDPNNPPGATGAIGGTLLGAITVDPSGAAVYSVPLAVPPGTAGIAPQLSLQYSSRGGEGMIGHGWSVAGISSITRCGKTKATDALTSGVKTRVNLDPTDQYCLDGQRLILVSGTLGGTAEFRTEIDGFSRIQSFGSNPAKGPDSWEVRDKEGLIFKYGTTADSTFDAQGRSPVVVLSWMLSRVEDRRGTFYTISYIENTANGEIYPSTIRYSGNGATITPYNAIDFIYGAADRPDLLSGYVAGSQVSVRKRLTTIRVRVDTAADGTGGVDTREYRLAYVQNPTSQRSLVQSLTDCARPLISTASAYECLPATNFTYQQRTTADNNFNAAGSGVWPGLNLEMPYEQRYLITQTTGASRAYYVEAREWVEAKSVFADFNGDGKLDNAYSNGNGVWRVCLSTGTSFNCQDWSGPSGGSAHVLVGDFNGDGRADIITPPIGTGQLAAFQVCLSSGTGFTCQSWSGIVNGNPLQWYYMPAPQTGQYIAGPNLYKVLDVNGDGRDDYIVRASETSSNGYACLSTGSGFTCSAFVGFEFTEGSSACPPDIGCGTYDRQRFGIASGDMSGDGRTDFASNYYPGSGNTASWRFCTMGDSGITCTSTVSEVGDYAISPISAPAGGTLIANMNHDGVDTYGDLFISRGNQGQICRSTGNGFMCTQLPAGLDGGDYNIFTLGDFDGDGRVDALGYNAQRGVIRICQLGGTYTCADWSGPQMGQPGGLVSTASPFHLVAWRMGDFNGDGRPDIAIYNRNTDQWSIYLANGPIPDLLASVTNGIGHQTLVTYGSLQDATLYTPDSTTTYPNRVIRDSTTIVKNVQASNALGGWLTTSYRYGGAKFSQDGRGFLGFAWFEATDSASNVITRTDVSQTFPTIGMPTVISGNHVGGVEIRRIVNTLTSTITANSGTSAPKSYFPFISRNVETSKELNNGSLVSTVTTDPISYDTYGNETGRTTTTVAGGETYTETATIVYSNNVAAWLLGRLTSVTTTRTAPGFANVTRQRTMTYTTLGELQTETIEPSGSTDLRLVTTLTPDPTTGVVTSKSVAWTETAAGGGWAEDGTARTRTLETLVFDPRWRYPTTVRNALNQSETRAYDQRTGSVNSLTGPNSITTIWQYDGFGRRTRETRADGTYSTTRYVQCTTDCASAKLLTLNRTFKSVNTQIAVPTVKYSDALLREVKWQSWTFDGRERIAERVYDARGRLASKSRTHFGTGETAQWTTFTNDDLGRVTQMNDPATGLSSTAYNGLTTVHTNSKSQTRTEVRNALGKLRTVTNHLAKTTTYLYEPFGNLARVTDPLGNQVNVTYDKLGRKTQLRDPNLGTWNYVQNGLGETRTQINASSQIIRFRYDALGRLQQRLAPDLNANWTYDTATKGVGKLAEAYTLIGTSTRDYQRLHQYDSLGRPSRSTVRMDYDYVTDSTYDTNGRLARTTYQRNTVGGTGGTSAAVDHRYNSYGYLDQLSLVGGSVLWSVNKQDALDRITRQTFGNGVVTRRDFNAATARLAGIVAGLLVSGEPSGAVQNDSYLYDSIGNLNYRSQLNDSGGLLQENFGYDGLNRLTSAQVTGQPAQTYGYNDLGNLTSKTGVGTYSYPASGATSVRPHAVSSITGTVAGVANPTFTYDANGNLTGGLGRTLTWSSHQFPLTITKAAGAGPGSAGTGSVTDQFVYGPELQRVKQTITVTGGPTPGTTTHWYTGGFERETRTADNTTHVRMFLPQGIVIVDRYTTAGANITTAATARQLRYYTKDRLGSTIAVTNETGAVLERQFYDPWGQRRNGNGTASTTLRSLDHRYGYTEHEMIDAIGLVHMNGRVYDPLIGRFMSADPTIPDPTDGQNYNRYSYVLNNPNVYTDPSGFAQLFQVDYQPGISIVGTGGGPFGGAFGGLGLSLGAMFEIPSLGAGLDPSDSRTGSICPTGMLGCTAFFGGDRSEGTRPKTTEEKLAQAAGQTNQTPQQPQSQRVASDIPVPSSFSCPPGTQCLETVEITGSKSLGQRIREQVSRIELMRTLEGVPQGAAIGGGIRVMRAGVIGSKATRGAAGASEAFQYTFSRRLASIRSQGLRPGSYATPNGALSPLQAHIDLALPANRGLPDALVRIDLAGLRQAGYQIPETTQVGRSFGMPGGGMEIQFSYPIPPQFITVLR